MRCCAVLAMQYSTVQQKAASIAHIQSSAEVGQQIAMQAEKEGDRQAASESSSFQASTSLISDFEQCQSNAMHTRPEAVTVTSPPP